MPYAVWTVCTGTLSPPVEALPPSLDLKGLTNFLRLCRSSKSQDLGGYIAAPTETENASQALRTGLNNVLQWALETVTSVNMLTFSCTLINHDKPFWKKLGQLLLQQLLMLSQQCSAASLMFFVFLEPMSQGWPPGMARMPHGASLVRGPQLLLQEESFSALSRRLFVSG